LLEINERQTYTYPENIPMNDPERAKKIADQDEDIFHTARLINCAWFGSAIFADYFSSILGLFRQGSTRSLNPFGASGPSFFYSIKQFDDNDMRIGNKQLGSQAFGTWSRQRLQRRSTRLAPEVIGVLTYDHMQFNCLYRWHATTSQADEQWVTKLMGSIFMDKPIDKVISFSSV
jgi:linoleate 10R-lipoxygenase